MLLLVTGCGKGNVPEQVEEKQGTVVFKYGDSFVTKGELYIYICTVKEQYESKYGEDVWKMSIPNSMDDSVTMVDLTKEEVVKKIIKVKTLIAHSSDYKVKLAENEESEIKNKAEEFFKGLTDAEIENMELTEAIVEKVMKENLIATKVQEKLLEKDPVEISDEQARMTTFFDMYFSCYDIDSKGNVNPYSDEERKKQYDNAIQACSTLATAKIDGNDDLESIQKLAEYYKLKQAKSQTMSPDQILETYGQEIYDMLYAMENGDYSTVVESQYGYHVFQMLSLTDRKATDEKKANMYDDFLEKTLSEKLEKWQKDIDPSFSYEDSVDMKVYDTITLDTK